MKKELLWRESAEADLKTLQLTVSSLNRFFLFCMKLSEGHALCNERREERAERLMSEEGKLLSAQPALSL